MFVILHLQVKLPCSFNRQKVPSERAKYRESRKCNVDPTLSDLFMEQETDLKSTTFFFIPSKKKSVDSSVNLFFVRRLKRLIKICCC